MYRAVFTRGTTIQRVAEPQLAVAEGKKCSAFQTLLFYRYECNIWVLIHCIFAILYIGAHLCILNCTWKSRSMPFETQKESQTSGPPTMKATFHQPAPVSQSCNYTLSSPRRTESCESPHSHFLDKLDSCVIRSGNLVVCRCTH